MMPFAEVSLINCKVAIDEKKSFNVYHWAPKVMLVNHHANGTIKTVTKISYFFAKVVNCKISTFTSSPVMSQSN